MSAEENKAIVQHWFQMFNDRDWPGEEAARGADFVGHVPGAPPLHNEGWKAFVAEFAAALPDFRLAIEDMVAEGDRVAVRWTLHGTQSGEFMGVPASGKAINVAAQEINRIGDGKVVEHWLNMDMLGLLQQLGAIPTPGE